jgi:hypothetical protein
VHSKLSPSVAANSAILASAGLAFSIIFTGCSEDPSLQVRLSFAYGKFLPAEIIETKVDVYEGTDFSCNDFKFGRVDATGLAAFRIPNDNNDPTILNNISRTDPKVLIARSTLADERVALIGCVEVGEIRVGSVVDLQLQPVAHVSFSKRIPERCDESDDCLNATVVVSDINDRTSERTHHGKAAEWSELTWCL